MGFVLIRHPAVNLRRVNMDRAPKDLGARKRMSERLVRQVRENFVVSVRCGKERDMTRVMTTILRHKDVQS